MPNLHEANDGDDLDEGKRKLGFTIAFYAKHVDGDDADDEYGDENSPCDMAIPEANG